MGEKREEEEEEEVMVVVGTEGILHHLHRCITEVPARMNRAGRHAECHRHNRGMEDMGDLVVMEMVVAMEVEEDMEEEEEEEEMEEMEEMVVDTRVTMIE